MTDEDPISCPPRTPRRCRRSCWPPRSRATRRAGGSCPSSTRASRSPIGRSPSWLIEQMLGGGFLDANTIRAALGGRKLTRRNADGKTVTLTAQQAIDLICTTPVHPGQADAYLPLLRDRLDAQRRAEFRDRVQEAARQYGDDPDRLLREVEGLVAQARRDRAGAHPPESLRLLPYFQQLVQAQQGTPFLGLDSGFPLLNQVTNGLDTGLWVIAAPPSLGQDHVRLAALPAGGPAQRGPGPVRHAGAVGGGAEGQGPGAALEDQQPAHRPGPPAAATTPRTSSGSSRRCGNTSTSAAT